MNVFTELIRSFYPTTEGFAFMWVLLILVGTFLALFFYQRKFYGQIGNVHADRFLFKIKRLILEGNAPEAEAICVSGGKRGLAKIALAALTVREATPEIIKSNVEEVVVSLSSQVERRNAFFTTIGNIATLVGLMGTIYGLILAFAAVGQDGVPAAVKTSMLASGISTAMNTTLFGLILAVPCMLSYSIFQAKADRMIEHFDRQSASILNALFDIDTKLKNYRPSERRRKKEEPNDLDITPIMGLMVVLIPLLLHSADFVKLGVIEMNLPKTGKGGGNQNQPIEKPKKLGLGLIVKKDGIYIHHDLESAISTDPDTAPEPKTPDVSIKNKDFDYDILSHKLTDIKASVLKAVLIDYFPAEQIAGSSLYELSRLLTEIDTQSLKHFKDFQTVKVMASNKTHFQKIINIMDASRSVRLNGRTVPLFPDVSIGAGF